MTLKFQSTTNNKLIYLFLTESKQYLNHMNATILFADKNSKINILNIVVKTLDDAFIWSFNELAEQVETILEFIQYD